MHPTEITDTMMQGHIFHNSGILKIKREVRFAGELRITNDLTSNITIDNNAIAVRMEEDVRKTLMNE